MMFSRRELINIAVPLMIQYMLSVMIGMVDTMMVSSAGEAAVSGVSLVNSLDTMLLMAFTSLVSGGSVVVAQLLGSKNMQSVQAAAKQLLYAATLVAVLITVLVLCAGEGMLALLFGQVEADVMASAKSYMFYIALSFPFLAMHSSGAALYRVMGNSTVTMVVSLGMNLINVAGNALLIMYFQMGAAGAAISTLISRVVGAVVLLAMLHSKKNMIYLEHLFSYRPDFKIIREILRIGIPNGIENSMFQLGKLLTQSLVSSLGTASIAAMAVANNLVMFQYMPGSVFGDTMVTVVGRCVGAEEKEQAKKYAKILTGANYLCVWVVSMGTLLFIRPLIGMYGLSAEGASMTYVMILYHMVCTSLIWPAAFTLPAAFRAASDVKYPMMVSMFSMWAFRVALSYILAPEQITLFGCTISCLGLGPLGVWVAMSVDWLFRLLLFVPRFLSGKWLTLYQRKKAPQ